jgi:hypothetical protein
MKDESDTNDDMLRELDTQGGFRVPAGYFVQLNRNIRKQTAGIADETGGFTAPEAYFEISRNRILEQTTGLETGKPALKIWYKRAITRYAAAAVIITGTFFSFYLPGEQKKPVAIAQTEITDEDIIEYFEVTDVRDIPATEVSFASVTPEPAVAVTPEEHYIILQTDEQSIIEEL